MNGKQSISGLLEPRQINTWKLNLSVRGTSWLPAKSCINILQNIDIKQKPQVRASCYSHNKDCQQWTLITSCTIFPRCQLQPQWLGHWLLVQRIRGLIPRSPACLEINFSDLYGWFIGNELVLGRPPGLTTSSIELLVLGPTRCVNFRLVTSNSIQ